jgi:hypothetical protein
LRVKRDATRWIVTQFIEEHTLEVIEKFALKNLRSHNNIPKEERKFVDFSMM